VTHISLLERKRGNDFREKNANGGVLTPVEKAASTNDERSGKGTFSRSRHFLRAEKKPKKERGHHGRGFRLARRL